MKKSIFTPYIILSVFLLTSCGVGSTSKFTSMHESVDVMIPIGGNTYLTSGNNGLVTNQGITKWSAYDSVFSTYFASDSDFNAEIYVRVKSNQGRSKIKVIVNDLEESTIEVNSTSYVTISVGSFQINADNYNKIDLIGIERSGNEFAEVSDIMISAPDFIQFNFVRNNQDNNFHWGRRGASVHLRHQFPPNTDIQWFYSEINVPVDNDVIGSFFMANGFSEGYFGFQVNSASERRILFSVWSPYTTDNPNQIPEEFRIQLLDKGDDVVAQNFGGEGSGGQSFLRYDWQAGQTYGFLTGVQPDGNGNTIYTSYFYTPASNQWFLIARFLRPKTTTWYKGANSFLENFNPATGYIRRSGTYKNQWVRDTNGVWSELSSATFTHDNTATLGYRLDYSGGIRENGFYLENGGFFIGDVTRNTVFTSPETSNLPDIDNANLLYFD